MEKQKTFKLKLSYNDQPEQIVDFTITKEDIMDWIDFNSTSLTPLSSPEKTRQYINEDLPIYLAIHLFGEYFFERVEVLDKDACIDYVYEVVNEWQLESKKDFYEDEVAYPYNSIDLEFKAEDDEYVYFRAKKSDFDQ